MKHLNVKTLLLAFTLVFSYGAHADEIIMSAFFDGSLSSGNTGNDCSGVFGVGEDCNIMYQEPGESIMISPIIAKFDVVDGGGDPNFTQYSYPSIDGTEWEFNPEGLDGSSGTWEYNFGDDDPGIKYWTAKGGNGFELFWQVDSDNLALLNLEGGDTCQEGSFTTNFNLACLGIADVVTAGAWHTPGGQNLSHIGFYDTDQPVECDLIPAELCDPQECDLIPASLCDPQEVPEPGMLLLFGLGLLTFGLRRKFHCVNVRRVLRST